MQKPHTTSCQPLGAERRMRGSSHAPSAHRAPNERDRHHHVVAVEPAQLREAREIAHALQARREVAAREEPAHVAPEEAVLARRVRVAGPVGVRVVMAMVRRPPQRPALHGRRAEHARTRTAHARDVRNARCEK